MKHKLIALSLLAASTLAVALSGAREANAGHHYFYYAPPAYYVAPAYYAAPVYYQPALVVPAPRPLYYAPPQAYYPVAPVYNPYWVHARKVEIEYDWNHRHGGWEVEYDFD